MKLEYAVLLGLVTVLGAGYAWLVGRVENLTFQRVVLAVLVVLALCSLNEMAFTMAAFYAAVAIGQGTLMYRDRPRPLWWKGQHERIEIEKE